MKWPSFQAAPGSLEALEKEARRQRNEAPLTAAAAAAERRIVRHEGAGPQNDGSQRPVGRPQTKKVAVSAL